LWSLFGSGLSTFYVSLWDACDLISFECKSAGEGKGLENSTFRFGLDPLHGFVPIAWERWHQGKRVISSQIEELGEFDGIGHTKFYFPKKTKFCYLKSDGITPLSEFDFELTSLSINKKYSDDDFTIDPGTANLIFDVDSNKVITVPR
jgi:hypothetical protein